MDKLILSSLVLLLIFTFCAKTVTKIEPIPPGKPVIAAEVSRGTFIISQRKPIDQNIEKPQFGVIYFGFNSAEIMQFSMFMVDSICNFLRIFIDSKLIIEGYCDERGDEDYNLELGERRAKAVRDQLVARGANSDNLMVVSYGEGVLA